MRVGTPRVTIADVAKEAHVSSMTVSRVVNHKGEISRATREKVEQAVAKLGYRPSQLARALTLKETRTLGFVVPDISNPFFSEIIRGAEDEAWERGYALLICSTVESLEREANILRLLEERHVDGTILCSARLPDSELRALLGQGQTTLLVNRHISGSDVASFEIDDFYGAMRAVHHLLGGGRERIGLLAGPEHSHSGRLRVAGYRTALETTGREVESGYIRPCSPDETGGYDAARALLGDIPALDGLFCYNDLVAIGALRACSELSVAVPNALAIVGCDDIRMASLTNPTLTTLGIDKAALGRRAVKLLLDTMSADATPIDAPPTVQPIQPIVQKPALIVRGSAP